MVKIHLNHNVIREVREGTKVSELVPSGQPIIAARLNDRLVGLNTTIDEDSRVEFVLATDPEGLRVHYESLIFLMTMAAKRAYPGARLVIEHSTSKGFYCTLRMQRPIEKRDVDLLEAEMLGLVADDLPITLAVTSCDELPEVCKENENVSKSDLLEYADKDSFIIHKCGNFSDWIVGPLVPSTGSLVTFELRYYPPGFILRFPTAESFPELPAFVEQPKLFLVFHDYEKWGENLGFSNVAGLNRFIKEGKGPDLVNISEAQHEKSIARIADKICQTPILPRMILIAGPSSAGKTTFSKRLAVHLRVNGLKPLPLSVDDYFLDRSETPLDEDYEPDLEGLEAIDLTFFNQQLVLLLEGKTVDRPRFNFEKGRRYFDGETMSLASDEIFIIEGIHALNPNLTEAVPKHLKFKIYVSALTQLNYHDQRTVSTSDTRKIRRILRDASTRGNPPNVTLERWPKVRRGEERNIFPYQESADEMFNSALVYELAVMRDPAIKLLKAVKSKGLRIEAQHMVELLELVLPMSDDSVPPMSILREFIGGSVFYKGSKPKSHKSITSNGKGLPRNSRNHH